jgi:hypothetical protein
VLDDGNGVGMGLLQDALSKTDGVVLLILLLAQFPEEPGVVLNLLLGLVLVVRHLSSIPQLHLSVGQPFQQHVHRLVQFLSLKLIFKDILGDAFK